MNHICVHLVLDDGAASLAFLKFTVTTSSLVEFVLIISNLSETLLTRARTHPGEKTHNMWEIVRD